MILPGFRFYIICTASFTPQACQSASQVIYRNHFITEVQPALEWRAPVNQKIACCSTGQEKGALWPKAVRKTFIPTKRAMKSLISTQRRGNLWVPFESSLPSYSKSQDTQFFCHKRMSCPARIKDYSSKAYTLN